MWFFLFACGLLDAPEKKPPETVIVQPAPAPEQTAQEILAEPAPFTVPVGHCLRMETTRFSCTLDDGVIVSLCEADGALQLRRGKLRRVDLRVPAEPSVDAFEIGRLEEGEELVHNAGAWLDGSRYTVSWRRKGKEISGGYAVRSEDGKATTSACRGEPTAEDEGLAARFPGDGADGAAWAGTWKSASGDAHLDLTAARGSGALLERLRLSARAEADADPTVRNVALKVDSGGLVATSPCELKLQRMVADTLYVDAKGCTEETGVEAGTYHRIP